MSNSVEGGYALCRLPREALFLHLPQAAWHLLLRGAGDCTTPAPRASLLDRVSSYVYENGMAYLRRLGWVRRTAEGLSFACPSNPRTVEVVDALALRAGSTPHRMWLIAQFDPRARTVSCWSRLLGRCQAAIYAALHQLRTLGLFQDGSTAVVPDLAAQLPAAPQPEPRRKSVVLDLVQRAASAGVRVIERLPANVGPGVKAAHIDWLQAPKPLGGPADTRVEVAAKIIYGHLAYLRSHLHDEGTSFEGGVLEDIIRTLHLVADPSTHPYEDGSRLQRIVDQNPRKAPFDCVLESLYALFVGKGSFTTDPKVLFRVTSEGYGWDRFVVPQLRKFREQLRTRPPEEFTSRLRGSGVGTDILVMVRSQDFTPVTPATPGPVQEPATETEEARAAQRAERAARVARDQRFQDAMSKLQFSRDIFIRSKQMRPTSDFRAAVKARWPEIEEFDAEIDWSQWGSTRDYLLAHGWADRPPEELEAHLLALEERDRNLPQDLKHKLQYDPWK